MRVLVIETFTAYPDGLTLAHFEEGAIIEVTDAGEIGVDGEAVAITAEFAAMLEAKGLVAVDPPAADGAAGEEEDDR